MVAVVVGGGAGRWDVEEPDEGGAHAVELHGLAGAAEDLGVGGLDGGFEACAGAEGQWVSGEGRGEVGDEGGGGEMAGDLSCSGSSHAVADDEGLDVAALGYGAGVLVALTDAAGIGELRVDGLRRIHCFLNMDFASSCPGRKIHGVGAGTKGTLVLRECDGGFGMEGRGNRIVQGDNLEVLRGMAARSVELIYIDPPFNTGRQQVRTRMKTVQDEDGDRVGFGGRRYRTERLGVQGLGYGDVFGDFVGFLRPRMEEARRVLSETGSLFFHIDYREVHYCKVMLDEVFGRECFQNEIIWAYDYGARAKKRWPAKHDNILWYTRDAERYTFNLEECDRIPYMAPGLVGEEKAARGKTPTDVWWHTIVSPTGKEKTGYATQKPLGVLERIVKVHSHAGETVLDFFAGSGTAGEAAARNGRRFVMVDESAEAVGVMQRRLAAWM